MNTATLSMPALVACAPFASTEKGREYLQGVCVEISSDRVNYVATDGHTLVAHTVEVEGNTLQGRWTIPTDVMTYVRRWRMRGSETAEFAKFAIMPDGMARLSSQGGFHVQMFKPVDGPYPEWRRLVPSKTSGLLGGHRFKGEYIQRVEAFAKAIGVDPLTGVAMHWNEAGPTTVTFAGCDSFCLLMPLRPHSVVWARPTWIDEKVDAS